MLVRTVLTIAAKPGVPVDQLGFPSEGVAAHVLYAHRKLKDDPEFRLEVEVNQSWFWLSVTATVPYVPNGGEDGVKEYLARAKLGSPNADYTYVVYDGAGEVVTLLSTKGMYEQSSMA